MTRPPLRIAAFSAVDLSLPQGHAIHLRGLLDELFARGHAVELVTPRPTSVTPPTRFARVEIPVLRLGVLVHWSFELIGGLALLLRALRSRPDLIYTRHDLYTIAPALVGALLRIPVVSEVNAALPVQVDLWGSRRARGCVAACERFSLRRASAIFALSDRMGEGIVERAGVDPSRIRAIEIATHLPAVSDSLPVRHEQGVADDIFLVGFAGNLAPVQGVERLIEAAAAIPAEDLRYWIIGEGVESERLRSRAGLSIRFFGGLPREESDRLLSACQVLVAPYDGAAFERLYGGAVSTKILNYLSLDRPVIVSAIESYRWIERLGVGELCPEPDLAGRIAAWRSRWIDAGRPLRDWPWPAPGAGRRWVEEHATWRIAAARVEEALRAILTASGRSPR